MSQTRTILLVSPWRGRIGPNVGIRQIAQESLRRGHRVHLVTEQRDEFVEWLASAGVACHRVAGQEQTPRTPNPLRLLLHAVGGWRLSRRIGRLARRVGADVLCVNTENMLLAPRASRLCGAPAAVILRGLRFGELGLTGAIYFWIQKRWVRRYVALGQVGADLLAAQGVPRDRIAIVPNGVDVGRFRPGEPPAALLAELTLPADQPVIGAVSHLTPRKGVHHLIEAAGMLRRRLGRFTVLVAGHVTIPQDRPYVRRLESRIDQLGLREHVRLLGDRRDVPDLLRVFRVLAHPSESENCPRGVLEAQATGLPVVGFRVGGMPEVVEDGVTGRLLPPFDEAAMADALEELLTDADRRRRMGAAGRAMIQARFDLTTNVRRLVDLLEQLAAETPAGRPEDRS